MLYQGHGSYRFTLNDGTVVYVDPFAGEGYDLPGDLILITHQHFDHNDEHKVSRNPACEVLMARDFQPQPGSFRTLESHGVKITGVQAYNDYHYMYECVGLVIEMDGITFYASGDTSKTRDMTSGKLAAMNIDYAVFCADGVYNMDVEEAGECAKLVGARHSIPIHLVAVDGAPVPERLFSRERAERFDAPGRIILEPGDTLELVAG